jgi:hypothetical protein
MMFRLAGVLITLFIVGYMIRSVASTSELIDNNPATQEQKEALRQAGVNPDDKDSLKARMRSQIQDIRDYQNQKLATPPD